MGFQPCCRRRAGWIEFVGIGVWSTDVVEHFAEEGNRFYLWALRPFSVNVDAVVILTINVAADIG